MHKIFLLFLFLTLPVSADAAGIFNNTGSFDIAKAVKLGRGKAYSVATDANLNTGAGKMEIAKTIDCDANCSKCDTSTGTCSVCNTGRYLSNNLCLSCSAISVSNGTCTACSGSNSCSAVSCNSGYYLIGSNESGSGCGQCPDGCSECSDSSMGVYCTACSSVYTMGSNSYGLGKCNKATCPAGKYLGSNPETCISCSSGTYSLGETATSCSSCSNLFVGSNGSMKFTCLSCSTTGTCLTCGYNGSSSGYEMSNGKCEYVGSNSGSSGSTCNSGGATAASPTNCLQGYGWGDSGCVTSSSQCKVCSQGSSLGGYCNCPAGSPSDGKGGCGKSCSYPYTNSCGSGTPMSGKCCRSSSDCYTGGYNSNCQ